MQLTRGTEYAIMGLTYLAMHEDRPVLLASIAESIGAPANYLSQVFQSLTRLGLVSSHRGARRGYTLARPAADINLRHIIEGIEGPITLTSAGTDRSWCGPANNGCSLYSRLDSIQDMIARELEEATLVRLSSTCGPRAGAAE
jgi:Rrf2 family protein